MMEDVQELLKLNGESNVQHKEDTKIVNIIIEELKQRLQKKNIPQKQKLVADHYFKAIDQELPSRTSSSRLSIQ